MNRTVACSVRGEHFGDVQPIAGIGCGLRKVRHNPNGCCHPGSTVRIEGKVSPATSLQVSGGIANLRHQDIDIEIGQGQSSCMKQAEKHKQDSVGSVLATRFPSMPTHDLCSHHLLRFGHALSILKSFSCTSGPARACSSSN